MIVCNFCFGKREISISLVNNKNKHIIEFTVHAATVIHLYTEHRVW